MRGGVPFGKIKLTEPFWIRPAKKCRRIAPGHHFGISTNPVPYAKRGERDLGEDGEDVDVHGGWGIMIGTVMPLVG